VSFVHNRLSALKWDGYPAPQRPFVQPHPHLPATGHQTAIFVRREVHARTTVPSVFSVEASLYPHTASVSVPTPFCLWTATPHEPSALQESSHGVVGASWSLQHQQVGIQSLLQLCLQQPARPGLPISAVLEQFLRGRGDRGPSAIGTSRSSALSSHNCPSIFPRHCAV
jgi:hypothetical protein